MKGYHIVYPGRLRGVALQFGHYITRVPVPEHTVQWVEHSGLCTGYVVYAIYTQGTLNVGIYSFGNTVKLIVVGVFESLKNKAIKLFSAIRSEEHTSELQSRENLV